MGDVKEAEYGDERVGTIRVSITGETLATLPELNQLCGPSYNNNGRVSSPTKRRTTRLSKAGTKVQWDKKERTYIARLFVTLNECLNLLIGRNKQEVSKEKYEEMAVFIHESMSVSSRNYHSVQHVFDISEEIEDPVGIIAALFHDCIYFHVDGGLSSKQEPYLKDVYRKAPDNTLKFFAATDRCRDKVYSLVSTIFGYSSGYEIPLLGGLNEFLSAIVAARMLEPHLDYETIAEIVCCIEATIPFRNKPSSSDPSNGPSEKLYQNMVKARSKFRLDLDDYQIIEAVQLSVIIANEDVANFGSTDRLFFLDNTWSLLPETNLSLRTCHLYSVKEFQEAVFKMNGFFNFLNASAVFATFRGLPSRQTIDKFTKEAEINLDIGKKYVGAKYLSASVLAAFAELTGGDTPMALLMGDLPSRKHDSIKVEDSLPKHSPRNVTHCDPVVYEILSDGRKTETTFDIKHSPLSAYLYGILGDHGLFEILKTQKMFPMDQERALSLLNALPRYSVALLARNIAKVAQSRSDKLQKLSDEYSSSSLQRRPTYQIKALSIFSGRY